MATKLAIDCRFGEAQVGDLLPLPSPLFDGEVIAKLVKVEKDKPGIILHTYDLYMWGVWIGRAQATPSKGEVYWMEVN